MPAPCSALAPTGAVSVMRHYRKSTSGCNLALGRLHVDEIVSTQVRAALAPPLACLGTCLGPACCADLRITWAVPAALTSSPWGSRFTARQRRGCCRVLMRWPGQSYAGRSIHGRQGRVGRQAQARDRGSQAAKL